jgi:cyclopropane fatty-acyl-phospholipid synthase-like methyltransferase
MDLYYDYKKYWEDEGRTNTTQPLNREHHIQLPAIISAVKRINPKSILEIGAGWGRITKVVRLVSDAEYLALDLSYDRLAMIDDKTVGRKVADFMDFYPEKQYDLIIAVEVLLHIPPDILERFVEKMKMYGKNIITLDYDPKEPRDIIVAEHNFLHDYDKLFPNAEINQVNYVQKMRIWHG